MTARSPRPWTWNSWRRLGCTAWASAAVAFAALGCSAPTKRLEYATMRSPAMGRTMDYAVYEPSDREPGERLPLVVFLHGGGDKVDCFDKAEVGQMLDEGIREGRIPRVVIAVPEGNLGFWENWADGSRSYRDWVIEDMMPQVQRDYDTRACPEDCHVMGISMGGHGALRFALKAPEHFSTVTALSAPIFNTDQMLHFKRNFWFGIFVPMKRIWGKSKDPAVVAKDDLYVQWTEQSDLQGMDLRFAWATKDRKGVIRTNLQFKEHVEEHELEHSSEVFEGKHEWWAWKPAIERALAIQVGTRDGAPELDSGEAQRD